MTIFCKISCAAGVLSVVIVIILIVSMCRMKKNHKVDLKKVRRDQVKRMWFEDKKVAAVPSVHAHRLGRNVHPEVRDKFGMNEIFEVTAGEGMDLAKMARPLATKGFGIGGQLGEDLIGTQSTVRVKDGELKTEVV